MRPAGYCVNNGRVNRRVGPWRLGPNSGYSFTATINDTNVLCITLCLRRTWLCGVHVVRNSPYNVTVKTTLTSAKVSWLPAHVEGGRYHHLVWYVHVVSVSITKSSRCNARHAPATSVCMSNCTCVCVCVCPPAHLNNQTSELRQIFDACPTAAFRCVCTSGFVDDVACADNGQEQATPKGC